MKRKSNLILLLLLLTNGIKGTMLAQETHPRIYVFQKQKSVFLERADRSDKVTAILAESRSRVGPYIDRHQTEPEWILSRLQMYWKTKYTRVYVNGMDFSHGEGQAPVPTVRFSGSRDWATDYLVPELEDVRPYMDDERGLYLQNGAKEGRPWEWVHPGETGHIIERINEKILNLARDAAFLYWLNGEEKYAVFAADIFMKYMEGMYHREPPLTYEDHHNAKLMGLQTFEVIHERIVEPVTVCYDFLHTYLVETGRDLDMITAVLKKWAEQEIKHGVPDNNWNLMQARYITYLALALEDDDHYPDGRGQQYYLDQMLRQNSEKQKALVDVMKVFDAETGMWPETSGYSTGVCEDILEVLCLIDRVQDNQPLSKYPLVEKATLATFQYLFPNGYTVAFGDAKHRRLRFNSLELLIAQYRKYGQEEKEAMITAQLKSFIAQGAYDRQEIHSLFDLFLYVEDLMNVAPASGIGDLVSPVFYAPNVSWLVQRNGMDPFEGMMISTNAAEGNHSHANGINIELYAKGMVFAPDCAAGVSYWSPDHREYYSRFPAHNTVIVDGQSDHRRMMSHYSFDLEACYPPPESKMPSSYTFSDVSFTEPRTGARQQRLTATVRTGETSGYFIDIFRSDRADGQDRKHEYFFHGQGAPVKLIDPDGEVIKMRTTEELSSAKGDLVGYDYLSDKREVAFDQDFIARFEMPTPEGRQLGVDLWMKGYPERTVFTALAPPSRALAREATPKSLYKKPLPTLVVRQAGEARSRPFVSVIEAYDREAGPAVGRIAPFSADKESLGFVGLTISSEGGRTDYVFNDEGPGRKHTFGARAFKGSYGVISHLQEEVHALFLGYGELLASDGWMIQSKQENNRVLVQIEDGRVRVSAEAPFVLTVPLSESGAKGVKLVDELGKEICKGKPDTAGGRHFARFELPAMSDQRLFLKD